MYKILIVEDDAALRYVYSTMKTWRECGFYIAKEAANGKDALEILKQEEYDVVVTDIRMPFIDGIELLKKINELKIDTHTIIISSYNEFEYARQGMILNAVDFLVKPINEKNLKEVLERVKLQLQIRIEDPTENFILEIARSNGIYADNDPFIASVCKYLAEHMDEVIAMDEVANAIGLSKDYFGKMFKQHTGMTFRFLYSLIKMEYAKMLIKTCRYKKYEISEMLGYASPDYFAKVFKEVTGMTPSQCRHECS